ncbi:spondin domain-containing protein [Algibacillus agarilyticus]|uniref:spondin domain-containing protein n=1 Tax=Algibacillus agarilyticus TaxID=2234133 RepID=UPI000DCF88D3|nr:spondin domain-containing protein [Algibacillus agarilyticus]
MKKKILFSSLIAALSLNVQAADLDISITNLTQGIYFTPIIASAHSADAHLFQVGQTASTELQAMAEGGDISGLQSVATAMSANSLSNPAGGLLAPGQMASGMLMTDSGNVSLSLAAMMLPTNDGFIGLDNWTIPTEAGTYTVYINAYDAGTEANDEIRGGGAPGTAGMPVPPPLENLIGKNGTGVTSAEENMMVHIHRGNLGDDDMMAGKSDVSNTVQRWLNPVAKLTVTVK